MGLYLNSKKASLLYKDELESTYFVDKTAMFDELIPLIEQNEPTDNPPKTTEYHKGKSNKYICITRPRRFGKSVMANMIAAYLGKGRDCRSIFDKLEVGSRTWYASHINKHNVIYITMNSLPARCTSYQQYIDRIHKRILRDLIQAYPTVGIDENDAVWDALNEILESETEDVKFIFILDEWDFIFHRDFITDRDKAEYIDFLSNLLKDQPYVEFAYMTGILPITKYSSGSELNMFLEYDMATKKKFSEYFGFLDTEVDTLYDIYCQKTEHPEITRDSLRIWYDGYCTATGKMLYNPRSIVCALSDNELLLTNDSLGYVHRLAKESEKMLTATLSGDTKTMAEILKFAHDTESPILSYNNEIELSAIVNLIYLAARDRYRVEREDKAEEGFVDFIFYPEHKENDGIILELKVDSTPEDAIQQIKDKNYVLRFKGKLGEKPKYTGKVLAVGISYDKKTKEHSCKVEVLKNNKVLVKKCVGFDFIP